MRDIKQPSESSAEVDVEFDKTDTRNKRRNQFEIDTIDIDVNLNKMNIENDKSDTIDSRERHWWNKSSYLYMSAIRNKHSEISFKRKYTFKRSRKILRPAKLRLQNGTMKARGRIQLTPARLKVVKLSDCGQTKRTNVQVKLADTISINNNNKQLECKSLETDSKTSRFLEDCFDKLSVDALRDDRGRLSNSSILKDGNNYLQSSSRNAANCSGGNSCATEARLKTSLSSPSSDCHDDTTINELASYFDDLVHIPKKMSSMAEMMYI